MPKKDRNVLTKVQRETLESLRAYISLNRQSPTIAELSFKLGLKSQTVIDRLSALQKKGFIRRTPHKWRNIEIVDQTRPDKNRMVQVPLLASVGADNMSVLAMEEFGQYLQIEEGLLHGHRDVFAVRAIGNSMRDANIFDGDYVLAEEASLVDVKGNQKVIAIVGDAVVVKRIELGEKAVILHPENSSGKYFPIIITCDREDFRVIGRVIDILPFSKSEEDYQFTYEPDI